MRYVVLESFTHLLDGNRAVGLIRGEIVSEQLLGDPEPLVSRGRIRQVTSREAKLERIDVEPRLSTDKEAGSEALLRRRLKEALAERNAYQLELEMCRKEVARLTELLGADIAKGKKKSADRR